MIFNMIFKKQAEFKVVLIGESGVGKTSLAQRFLLNTYKGSAHQFAVVNLYQKAISVDGTDVRLNIFDTAGLHGVRSNILQYIRIAHGILLMYDVTSKESFHRLSDWMKELRQLNREAPILIVGNKIDRGSLVSRKEATDFANSEGLAMMEVSAKTGDNVQLVFERLVSKIISEGVPMNSQNRGSFDTARRNGESCDNSSRSQAARYDTGMSGKQRRSKTALLLKALVWLCIFAVLSYFAYHLGLQLIKRHNIDLIQWLIRVKPYFHQFCEKSQVCDHIPVSFKRFYLDLIQFLM